MDVLVSSNSCFHPLVSLITTMHVLVRLCVWVLGFYKLEALRALMRFLEFAPWIVAMVFVLFFFFFSCELHVMVQNLFNDFLIGK